MHDRAILNEHAGLAFSIGSSGPRFEAAYLPADLKGEYETCYDYSAEPDTLATERNKRGCVEFVGRL